MSDIMKCPGVKGAIKEGRPLDDIAVLECPRCGQWGYYNQGSNFYCRKCRVGFYCCSEDEDPPDFRPYVRLDTFTTVADLINDIRDEGNVP